MKSMVKILVVTIVIGFFGCRTSNNDDGDGSVTESLVNGNKMFTGSFKDIKSDIRTIPLSSLVENCELLKLDRSTDDAFFKLNWTTVTDNYIGVAQWRGYPYLLFDRSGKFLNKVGSIGQGPGEYSKTIHSDLIDEKNGLIYLAFFQSDRIFVYDLSGKFKKYFVVPFELNKPKIFLSDSILTAIHMNHFKQEQRPVALQFDVNNGALIKELAPLEHLIINDFYTTSFSNRNISGIFDFFQTKFLPIPETDTLYHFDVKKCILKPFFTMGRNPVEKTWFIYYQLNKDLVFTSIEYMDPELGYHVRKALIATDLKNKTSSYIRVVNDYYGNMTVPFNYDLFSNGYFVWNLQPEELMEEIEKRLAESDCTENDKQALLKTLSTLKENENNVIFIGKLKNETQKLW